MKLLYRLEKKCIFDQLRGRSPKWIAGIVFIVASLQACSVLPESTPQRVYQLPEPVGQLAQANEIAKTGFSLRVSTPSSPLVLASNRILVMSEPNQLAAFKGVRWADPMPELFQQRLVSYLRESNHWQVVSTDEAPLGSDYQLNLSLLQFHAIRIPGQTPGVSIRLHATLSDRKENKALANRTFAETAVSTNGELLNLLDAYGAAANEISAQISTWAEQYTD